MRYRDSGVDIDRANQIVRGISELAPPTWGPRVLSRIGHFGGLFDASDLGRAPVLVCSVDGVGTKTHVATLAGRYRGLGVDIVHHSVNDILVQGARPLLFMDYVAAAQLEESAVLEIVGGMVDACRAHACALLGGETAEMPGTYTAGDYDVVGSIVGVAERDRLLTGEQVRVGDEVWGLPSSGLHTNGYSLARRILLEEARLSLDATPDGLETNLGAALLEPHRSYFEPLWPLLQEKRLHALVHITGGGFFDNIPRVLPAHCEAEVDPTLWEIPPLFRLIERLGNVATEEMRRVFNLGIGMVVLVDPANVEPLLARCPEARRIGRVVAGTGGVRFR
ncbi:MAG: phosphoribosylformylglycinamidine cyclo-ligase [Candidatus Latescibacterota bacterium]|nr:MAG: phosphoribosylformylglycinamidine cyclo-ligase [Candidatus Latescibacterota bacterium]